MKIVGIYFFFSVFDDSTRRRSRTDHRPALHPRAHTRTRSRGKMFTSGQRVLVNYPRNGISKYYEAVLKEKKQQGWEVIWLCSGKHYGTLSDGISEADMLCVEGNKDVYIREMYDLVGANNRQMNTVFKPAQMDIQSRLTDIQHAVNTLTYAVDGLYRGSSPMPPLQALDTQLLTEQLLTEQSL